MNKSSSLLVRLNFFPRKRERRLLAVYLYKGKSDLKLEQIMSQREGKVNVANSLLVQVLFVLDFLNC